MNPTTLTQGQQFQGGTVQFDAQTGARLGTGQTTTIPTIEASKLGTSSSALPAVNTPTTATQNLGIQASSSMIQPVTPTTETVVTPTTDRNTILQSLMDLINKQGTKGAETIQAQEEAGVFAQQQKLTELQNQYTAKEQAYAKQEEEIRKNATGALSSGVQIQLDNLSRQKNSELADIAINVNMTKGLYDTAFDIAKTKIDAEFEPIQAQIDGLKIAYDFLQNDLTDSEKMKAQALINEQQSQADFERDKKLLDYKARIDLNQTMAEAEAKGLSGTESQFKAGAFANRLEQANPILEQLAGKFSNMSQVRFMAQLKLPSYAQSPDMQQFSQAARNYINAQLRRESGAVISPEEFDSAIKQYIPAPWDSPAVQEQKRQNRLINQRNLINEAQNAYQPLSTELTTTVGGTTNPNEQVFNQVTNTGGFFSRLFSGMF